MATTETGRVHALLIAIDDYDGSPLSGCVNDIDQVQSFLIEKLSVPRKCIRRLEAPIDPLGDHPVAADCLPTYDNLVAELRQLASGPVQPGDRVLVYYSGHGSYQKVPAAESYFEGLVPLDHQDKGLLLDIELNRLLQAIADRSGDLTVVLDCCHSAGATRDVTPHLDDSRTRVLSREQPSHAAAAAMSARILDPNPYRPAVATAEYTVITACHADETAAECRMPPRVGRTHGLLTYCLFDILNRMDAQALGPLRFSDIWEQLKARVSSAQPSQRPMLLGPPERRIFGGPWRQQDAGHAIARQPDGSYLIAAGSLAGLGPDAQLAVYGAEPALFPPLNSASDQQARLGILVVASVEPAQATAWPLPRDAPFDLPPAPRGRLIKHGKPDLLRVALHQNLDSQVRLALIKNAPEDNFMLLPESDPRAEVNVGQYENGDLWIGDDLFGPGPPVDPVAPGPMGRVRLADADEPADLGFGLRAGLHHYAQYVIPLRVYRNGGFTLPPSAVAVKVLDCNDTNDASDLESDASARREADRDEHRGCYILESGDLVAFHVRNTLAIDLHVFLLLCNLEGQIEFLDGDALVHARSGKIFWRKGIIGNRFPLASPKGYAWGIDRLIVIATDQKGMNLGALNQRMTMNETIRAAMLGKSGPNLASNPPGLSWMAVQTLLQIGQRSL